MAVRAPHGTRTQPLPTRLQQEPSAAPRAARGPGIWPSWEPQATSGCGCMPSRARQLRRQGRGPMGRDQGHGHPGGADSVAHPMGSGVSRDVPTPPALQANQQPPRRLPWPFTHGTVSRGGDSVSLSHGTVPRGGTASLHHMGEELHEQGWRAAAPSPQLPSRPLTAAPHRQVSTVFPPVVAGSSQAGGLGERQGQRQGKGGRRRGQGEGRGERCPRSAKGTRGSQLPGEQSAWALQTEQGLTVSAQPTMRQRLQGSC